MKACFALFGVCFVLSLSAAYSQSHVVVGTDASGYPNVVSRAYAFGATGTPEFMANGSVTLKQDGADVPVTASSETVSAGRGLSLVVMVDVSNSMAPNSPSNFDLARGAATVAPSLLADQTDEIALGMFDRNATLLHGLTSDKAAYTASLNDLRVGNGSDLNAGLLAMPMGGLVHVQNARFGRAVILIVDGTSSYNVLNAVQVALSFRTQVYILGLRTKLSADVKQLADTSGGLWVEDVATQNDANAFMQAFVSHAKRLPATLLSFTSPSACGPSHAIAVTRGAVERTATYLVPSHTVPTLEWSVGGIDFGSEGLGGDDTVRLTARGKAVTIASSAISDASFVIMTPLPPNVTLQPDQSRDIVIRFTGAASSHFATLNLTSNGCDVQPLYLRGGKHTAGATLKLVSPNGAETYTAGIDTMITWTNTIPEDIVRLEVSPDGGATWNSIIESAKGNAYRWTPGPMTSSNALIRVQRTIIDQSQIKILRGHREPVYSCDFSASGQRVITGGDDGTVRVWTAATGVEERVLGTHQGWVWTVAAHPLLNIAASGGHDGTVRIWDIISGERLATINASSRVWSVAFNGDGTQLAVGSENAITIINTSDWSTFTNIAVGNGPVYACAFSKNNDLLITGENDVVGVRHGRTFAHLRNLTGHTGPIYAVAATPDASKVFSGGADFAVRIWNGSTGLLTGTLPPSSAAILSLDVSNDGTRVLVGGGDATAKIYQISDLSLLSSLAGHSGLVYGARFDNDATHVVTAATDETARVWDSFGVVLSTDISDARFSIVGGTTGQQDVDHGAIAIGSGNDRTSNVILNTGTQPVVIKSARITSGDVDNFSLLQPVSTTVINAGERFAIETAFSPGKVGAHNATVQIVTGTGIATVQLSGTGVNPRLDVPQVVDFGRHLANQTVVDSTIVIKAPQTAGTVNITRTNLIGQQAGTYSIVSGGGAFSVNAATPHQIQLRFEPITFGRFGAMLELVMDNGESSFIRLYGEGTGDARISSSAQSMLFSTDRCSATPDEESVTVTNNGTSTLQIYVASISGAHQNEFSIVEPTNFPVNLNATESATFKVRFTPLTAGQKDAKLVLSSNAIDAISGVTQVPLVARKDSVYFELSRSSMHFNNINEGEPSTQVLTIFNSGTVSLRWEQVPIDLGDFRIDAITPQVTAPGQQSEVTIRFKGGVVGQNYAANYTFRDSVCNRTAQLQLTASVRSYIGCRVTIDTVHAMIGGQITVPIRVSNKVNFDRTNIQSINARLRVNGTILTPAGSIDKGLFVNGARTFDVSIPIPSTGDVAMSIPFDVTWGNDTSASIQFDSVWTDDTVLVRTSNGMVYLDNLCREGGPRILLRTGQTAGIRVAPQPATNDAVLELSVLERGPTSVVLIDISGREVMSLVERDLSPGSYLIPFDTTTLENGAYTLLLTTRTQRISQRISVVR